MVKKKKHNSVFRAVALRSAILVAAIWFCAMFLLTWAVAADMLLQVKENVIALNLYPESREITIDDYDMMTPGDMEVNTLIKIAKLQTKLSPKALSPFMSSSWLDGDSSAYQNRKWNLVFGVEAAAVYYDDQDNIIAKSGSFFSFAYSSKEYANAPEGRAYVDVDAMEDYADELNQLTWRHPIFLSPGPAQQMPRLRLTGRFQGNAFCPVTVDYCNDYAHTWWNLLTVPDTGEAPLVTIYGWDIDGFRYDHEPLSVNGVQYESLIEYLLDFDPGEREDNLFDAVFGYGSNISDSYGYHGFELAVRCRPVQYALFRLWPTYLISAAVVSLGLLWYLLWLRKSVAQPVKALASALKYGAPIEANSKLNEINELQQLSASARAAATESNTQLQQLRTALDYAHNAEENRRQLVSDITHELKTPLAVIHSYAECLQENVVPEKREQYLSVILEETRHMDTMVLQMLDLSRLEAGKVRLSSDTFSLLQLTKQIFEKFSPMLSGKNLRLYWQSPEDVLLTADEARMTQAVTNLVSNAVKYTPVGGEITVKILDKDRKVLFSINNTAAHLSPEALEKVWDSFYRADPSRTEPGTGLGLALVKSIIQLHGGQCFVRNTSVRYENSTETGVEFGFTIPLP